MLLQFVRSVNARLPDFLLVAALLSVGLWYSVQTRFVQVRCFREALRRAFGASGEREERRVMVSWRDLPPALTARLGAGNLVGAGGAVLTGGPGALFWLWLAAFLGMATAYAEAVLAARTRQEGRDLHAPGGSVRMLTAAFAGSVGRGLAALYALGAVLVPGFFGSMVQSNAVGETFRTAFGLPPWCAGLALAGICGAVAAGRARRLVSAAERALPVVTGLFLAGGAMVLLARVAYLPAALWMVFRYAFTPDAVIGGGAGAALRTAVSQGVKRGLFSNEAGMGSASRVRAPEAVTPHERGLAAMAGVFADTFAVLTPAALVMISTLYTPGGPLEHGCTGAAAETLNGANLAQTAFGTIFGGGVGAAFVALCLLCFALSALLRWNRFGRVHMVHLFGRASGTAYTAAALVFVFLGTLVSSDLVRELADLFSPLLVVPNALALFALTGLVRGTLHRADRERPDRSRRHER